MTVVSLLNEHSRPTQACTHVVAVLKSCCGPSCCHAGCYVLDNSVAGQVVLPEHLRACNRSLCKILLLLLDDRQQRAHILVYLIAFSLARAVFVALFTSQHPSLL